VLDWRLAELPTSSPVDAAPPLKDIAAAIGAAYIRRADLATCEGTNATDRATPELTPGERTVRTNRRLLRIFPNPFGEHS
jgi:hypothetical protein